jgi:hypothetical protein
MGWCNYFIVLLSLYRKEQQEILGEQIDSKEIGLLAQLVPGNTAVEELNGMQL